MLDHWKVDPDLAGLRAADALSKFPEEEQRAWNDLWDRVERLRTGAPGPAARP